MTCSGDVCDATNNFIMVTTICMRQHVDVVLVCTQELCEDAAVRFLILCVSVCVCVWGGGRKREVTHLSIKLICMNSSSAG